jgi:hypothetical protein
MPKFVDPTLKYLDEIVSIYEELVAKVTSKQELEVLKKRFIDINQEIKDLFLFEPFFEDRVQELEISTMDYISAHKHLEGWINYYINFILRGYLIRIPKFYDLKLKILEYKFLLQYGEYNTWGYKKSEGCQNRYLLFSGLIKENKRSEIKEIIQNSMKELRQERRIKSFGKIPKDFHQDLKKKISNELEIYRHLVRTYFLEYSHFFLYYDSEVKIYLIKPAFGSKGYRLCFKTYQSHKFSCELNENLFFHKIEDFNYEERQDKAISTTARYIDDTCLDQNGSILYLSPFNEIFNLLLSTIENFAEIFFLESMKLLGFEMQKQKSKIQIWKAYPSTYNFQNNKNEVLSKSNYFYITLIDSKDKLDYTKKFKWAKTTTRNTIFVYSKYTLSHNERNFPNNQQFISMRNFIPYISRSKGQEYLAAFFREQLKTIDDNRSKETISKYHFGTNLLEQIASFSDSKNQWHDFEKLVEDIFKFLFQDSFITYTTSNQRSEKNKARRPDLIIANNTPKENFWKTRAIEGNLRIVVDAKHYTKPISRDIVTEFWSKYLIKRSTGRFGIIVSLKGYDQTAHSEVIQQFHTDNKDGSILILILDSFDLEKMIELKMKDKSPEEILEKKVTEIILDPS